jgi:surface carbohydrate biosynthesis protein
MDSPTEGAGAMTRLVDVRKPRIMLGVDHKWRDLQAYSYLKLLLERRYGFEVALIRRTWEPFYLSIVRPDIIVFEGLFYDQWTNLARDLHSMGVKVVILPTEGAPASLPGKIRIAGKQYDHSMVDLFCSWNQQIKDLILQLGKMPEERVKVTGAPRFDIYRPPLRGILPDRAATIRSYGLQPDRPTITFATNYVWAGLSPEILAREWEAIKAAQTGVDYFNDPTALAEGERKTRDAMMDSMVRLRKDLGNVNIILRPHPSEDQAYYRRFLSRAGVSDVPLVYGDYIWNVLNATDVLVARTSTVSFDAWFSGKPTIEFQIDSNPFSKNFWKEFQPGSDAVETYDQLRDRVTGYLEGARIAPAMEKARADVLGEYFYKTDGHSSERVGEALRQLAETIPYSPQKDSELALRFLPQGLKLALGELKGFFRGKLIRHLLGRQNPADYLGRFDRFIYPGDIRTNLRKMRGHQKLWMGTCRV